MKAYKEAERFYGSAFNNPSDTESAVLNIKTDNFYGFYQTAAHKYFEMFARKEIANKRLILVLADLEQRWAKFTRRV
jgi:hypothetical protein